MIEVETERDSILSKIGWGSLLVLLGATSISLFTVLVTSPFGGMPGISKLIESFDAPTVNSSAVITSKEFDNRNISGDPSLAIKGDYLQDGGAFINVSESEYAAASVGDVVCVRYKKLTGNRQYGLEFVNQGRCN